MKTELLGTIQIGSSEENNYADLRQDKLIDELLYLQNKILECVADHQAYKDRQVEIMKIFALRKGEV